MKTRTIIFLAVAAFATLSFTFVNIEPAEANGNTTAVNVSLSEEPAGGFAIDDK